MALTARICLALLMTSLALEATAAHITDKLLAGFYDQPAAQGQPTRVLPSGTPVEILERRGEFSRVRLTDNTEGWIQSKYLTDEKPAKAMLLEAQARAGALEQELARAKQQLAQAQQALKSLTQGEPQQGQAKAPPAQAPLLEPDAPSKSADLVSTRPWAAILAGLSFIAGLGCGMALFNYRFRKRFAGLHF